MVKDKILRAGNRFGTRYGRKTREKVAKIEYDQHRKHKCPYCNAIAVKRLSIGIWSCRKCSAKFTSRAYTVGKTVVQDEQNAQSK